MDNLWENIIIIKEGERLTRAIEFVLTFGFGLLISRFDNLALLILIIWYIPGILDRYQECGILVVQENFMVLDLFGHADLKHLGFLLNTNGINEQNLYFL
jgi:hypothetical protein